MGYQQPTPIQEQAIPKILEGRDLRASAQTGTGKTAAFLLPAIQQLTEPSQEKRKSPSILVVVPTRELAMQVATEAKKFTKYLPQIKTVTIYGGMPYPIQNKELKKKYDILVATPGRLLDHMDRGRINLSSVKMIVLDEADRMLDMGFIDDVEKIVRSLPTERQTLLFSATLDETILPISKKLQHDPCEIRVESPVQETHPVEQHLYYVDNLVHKKQILEHLLSTTQINQTIIFTSTIRQADELSDQLRELGYHSASLHGDMSQRQRTRTIEKVRKGLIRILVATDVAARGIDISTLSHVFNFDLPFQIENYLHRIGRTGRAGAKGLAISFISPREEQLLHKIKKHTGLPIECKTIEGLEPKNKSSKGQSKPRFPRGFKEKRNFRDKKSFGEKKSFRDKKAFDDKSSAQEKGPFEERRSFGKKSFGEKKSFRDKKAFDDKSSAQEKGLFEEKRSFGKKSFGEKRPFDTKRPFREKRHFGKRNANSFAKKPKATQEPEA